MGSANLLRGFVLKQKNQKLPPSFYILFESANHCVRFQDWNHLLKTTKSFLILLGARTLRGAEWSAGWSDGGCASSSRLPRCARNDTPNARNDREIASAFRCAACLAMTHAVFARRRNDTPFVFARRRNNDEAMVAALHHRDCFAALAMTQQPLAMTHQLLVMTQQAPDIRTSLRGGGTTSKRW